MSEIKRVSLSNAKIILANASDEAMNNPKLRDTKNYSRFMEAVRNRLIVVDDQKERDVPDYKRTNAPLEIER